MERQEKLEAVAVSRFLGLTVEYHKRMGEALIHALVSWIPEDHIDGALSDVRYYSDQLLKEVEAEVLKTRLGRYIG